MEKYEEKMIKDTVLTKVYCNKCGKLIFDHDTKKKSDYLSLTKEWGYFSNKDMEIHNFDLCEACYDAFIESFKYPPNRTKK